MEFDPKTHIERGYIDIADDVAFKTIKDACNCFGHSYKGYQQAAASHPDHDVMLWFPKLFQNNEWDNDISFDEETITEKNVDEKKNRENIKRVINNNNWKAAHKRIVFAKVQDNFGKALYQFKGLYELNVEESKNALVWKRSLIRVKTHAHFDKPPNRTRSSAQK